MIPERLIERYAKAALPLFKNNLDEVKALSKIFDHEPLLRFLIAPMIDEEKKLKILELYFGKAAEIKALVTLLIKHGRIALLPGILSRCQEKLEGAKGQLTLAQDLDSATESELISKIKKAYGSIPLVQKIDQSLIGGFTLMLKNSLLDASIKGSLSRIKKQLGRETCA